MSEYKVYLQETNKRKEMGLGPKPIDSDNLARDIIGQILDLNHPFRKDSIQQLIYNVSPGTTSAANVKANFLKDIIQKKSK